MLNNKPALVGATEMDVGPQKSYSIVLYIDRYDHRVFGVAEDAVAAYSEQDIKEFLKEQK